MVARLGRLLAMCLALWVALPAWAQQAQIQLEPPRLQVGQTGRMTLYVVGGRPLRAPKLEAPEGVEIAFDGSYQRFHTDGFDRVLVYYYRYRVTPLVEGEHLLGGWDVELKGASVRVGTSTLQAVPRQALDLEELQVEAGFDVTEAWEGQVVVYDYELVASVPTMGVDWRLPEFEGLRPTPSGEAQRREYYVDDPGGGTITITGGSIPLIVTGFGDRGQPGALAHVRVAIGGPSGVFGLRQYKSRPATSAASKLVARPLPEAPEGFTGLVGDFEFRGVLAKKRAVVGESVEWALEVVGDGSLDGWKPPELPDAIGVAVYDSDGAVQAAVDDGRYRALGRFPRVLVPSQPGTIELPRLELVTFSPSQGRFVTHRVDVGRIEVGGGAEAGGDVQSFAGELPEVVDESGIDFRPNRRWGTSRTVRLYRVLPVLSAVVATPAFALLALAGLRRGSDALADRLRAEVRPPTARERLAALPADREARLTGVDAALRQALADRVGTPLDALDREAAIDGLPSELAARVRAVQRDLDRARFADAGSEGLEARVGELVAAIDAAPRPEEP